MAKRALEAAQIIPVSATEIPAQAPRRARGRPRTEDVARLEADLIRVARRCFIAKGYGATSMNEVAKAAGVSKGTLYARFPSKADLFRAIIDEQIHAARGGDRFMAPRAKTLEAALRGYAERALEDSLSGETVQLNRLIFTEAGRFPELGEAESARVRVGVQHLSELIAGYAEKEGVPCRDPEGAARLFTTLLRGFYSDVLLKGEPVPAAEIKAWTRGMLKVLLAGRSGW